MIQLADCYYPMYEDNDKMIILVTGGRGCETPTQEIVMADLSVKMIKDIKVGDLVMGDDGTPRKVLGTMHGTGMMYKVHQSNAEDYFVNESHILTVSDGKTVKDINVIDYMNNPTINGKYKGFKVVNLTNKKSTVVCAYSDLTITENGIGEWCGISLDGNQRYIHSDGTVTHNSGKSFSTGTFIERLTFEAFPKHDNPDETITHTILYTRYTMVSAAISVIPEMLEKIDLDGVSKYFKTTRSDVQNLMTGAKIMFRGIHTSSGNQTAKLKSIHGITTFVVDEAEEWTSEEEFDKIMLSIRQKGIRNRVIIIMNPTDSNHFVYRRFIKDTHKIVEYDGVPVQISTHPDVLHIHTTYLDNIDNLSEDFIRQTKGMKEDKPEKYAHTVMGQWADVAEGAVFKKWGIVDKFPDEARKVALGVDFGFVSDPTAIVKCGIVDNRLYIEELCYETHMLISDIIAKLKPHKDLMVIADSADPRLIQEIFNGGILIYPVIKGGGSILAGIEKMKDMELFVTKDSYNLQEELRNYVWDRDKNGNYINKPVDRDNHCFVGETLVTTSKGDCRIDNIKVGDLVLTSGGYRRVMNVFNQGIRKVIHVRFVFNNFSVELKATADHKIKTSNKWKQLSQIYKGDILFIKSLMANATINTPTSGIIAKEQNDCTVLFGSSITEQSQKDIKSITKTKTPKITVLKTSNCSTQQSTCNYTPNCTVETRNLERNNGKTLTKHELRQPNGTSRKVDENGIANTPKTSQSDYNMLVLVNIAGKNLTHQSKQQNSAQINAKQHTATIPALTTKRESASVVDNHSQQTNLDTPAFVPAHAAANIAQPCEVQKIEILSEDLRQVYDIEVEEYHEFFANGVLVHNCIDASRYYVLGQILGQITKPVKYDSSALGIF